MSNTMDIFVITASSDLRSIFTNKMSAQIKYRDNTVVNYSLTWNQGNKGYDSRASAD